MEFDKTSVSDVGRSGAASCLSSNSWTTYVMHCNMCSKCSRQPSSTAEEAGGNEYLQIVRGLQRGAFTAGGAGAMVNSDRLANKVEGVSKSEVEDEEDWEDWEC